MRTDAELLRSYDPEAFGEFYERHVGAVAAYLGRRTRHPDVLFDLLSETFARAYEHRAQQDPRKGPAIAWLLNTARYVVADAERRGQVPDGARTRLKLEPFLLGDTALAAITERSRADLAEALAGLPESQRIAVYRRVLTDDEYQPAPAPIGVSNLVKRDSEARRKERDPFELLGERLFLAAGGRLQRSRGTVIAIAATVVMLLGAGLAVAALRLTDEDEPPAQPTPTPVQTPTAAPPDPTPTATPTPGRPRSPRAQPGTGGVTPQPVPTPETFIDLQLVPDLRPGRVGWCVDVSITSQGLSTGHRGCTPAGPPGTMILATGGVAGTPGAGYAIVDEAVAEIRLSDGRRITPEADPSIPSAWRAASWNVSGQLPSFTLHDGAGNELQPFRSAPIPPLQTRRVPAADPPRERCAIRARGSLETVSARMIDGELVAQDALRPSYLACASTVYRVGNDQLRATVLLDARDPDAVAAKLPSTGNVMAVRREGRGWLAVYGGTSQQRARVLRALRVTGP